VRKPCNINALLYKIPDVEFLKPHAEFIGSEFVRSFYHRAFERNSKSQKSSNVKLFLLKIHLQSNVSQSTLGAYQCRTSEGWGRESFYNT